MTNAHDTNLLKQHRKAFFVEILFSVEIKITMDC